MKIYEIRNYQDKSIPVQAYLFYFSESAIFRIELLDQANPWDLPASLFPYARKGITTLNSMHSHMVISDRIIPRDRQNIGMILKEHKMETYDEYAMLMLAKGRCAQDEFELKETSLEDLPESLQKRLNHRLKDFVIEEDRTILAFFYDGTTKRCDLRNLTEDNYALKPVLLHDELFQKAEVLPGGCGLWFQTSAEILYTELYDSGEAVPVSYETFKRFIKDRTVPTVKAAELLDTSRQNISAMVKTGKLVPQTESEKNMTFLKAELIEQ